MEFKTKFKVWDFVHLIDEGKILNGMIKGIDVIARKREINRKHEISIEVKYIISVPGKEYIKNEKDLYRTKKEATIKLMEQLGYEVSENDLKEIK